MRLLDPPPPPRVTSNYGDSLSFSLALPHLRHLPTGVPDVHVQHSTSEATEFVLAVKNLDGVPPADALALQVIQLVGSNEVATAVGIAPTSPAFREWF